MTSKKKDTRRRILEVAARLFAEKGYYETSTRDIAAELSIASPSLYYHFDSKGSILTELLREPFSFMKQAVEQASSLPKKERTQKRIEGLLGALEFHNGIIFIANNYLEEIPDSFKKEIRAYEHSLFQSLAADINQHHSELRIAMAVGAVEGVVKRLIQSKLHASEFSKEFRNQRASIIDIVMMILLN